MRRNLYKMALYKDMIGGKCANPNCEYGFNAETHHIFPIKQGGSNDYWNFICLCFKCHRKNHNHSHWDTRCTELFLWKSLQELEEWGFYLDEQDPDYYDKLKILLEKRVMRVDKYKQQMERKKRREDKKFYEIKVNRK